MALARPQSVTLQEVMQVLTFQGGYNTNAVLVGCSLLGLACGVVGVFAVLRKRALVADAVGHATLPGIVSAFIIAVALGAPGRSLPVLLLGAAIAGALSVLAIFAILRFTRLREDAAIGIVLGVSFGIGVVLLSYVQNPQNTGGASPAGLTHFIYGQTAAMRARDAFFMAVMALAAVLLAGMTFKELALTAFNEDYGRVLGLPVGMLDGVALGLLVLVTVAGLQAVGLILVIALLIIPPVSARLWTDRLVSMVLVAALLGALTGYTGAAVSALLPRAPAGAIIVLCGGGVFLVSLLASPRYGVIAEGMRRALQRNRIAGEHLLEAAYEHTASRGGEAVLADRSMRAMQRLWGWPSWLALVVIADLRRRGFLERLPEGYKLTEEGVHQGKRIARNHELWEQYLLAYADVAPGHVDWSADMVEHVLSPELVAELEQAVRRSREHKR